MAAQQNPRASELNQDDWLLLDATVERLEEVWRTDANPQLAAFVPPGTYPLRIRVLVELVKVDQEHRWETGDHRFLEDYLAQWPELAGSPDALADLVEAECLTRAVLDRLPTADELAHRFPAIAQRIDLDRLAKKIVREDLTVRMRTPDAPSNDTIQNASGDTPVPRMSGGDLRVGGRLGRYEIRALLGRGGMGTVYRAYDPQLDREVALKIPRFDPAVEPELLERFIREARVAARIRHPHVCPVYDAGRMDGVPYLTMALIDGGSLENRARLGIMSPRDAIEMICKLAAGLEAIHVSGIVHRDVKPSNVLIDRGGEPLLADFGLARPLTGSDATSTAGLFSGTPAYMAPEQVAGGTVDARTDVYSLAVLLWRLITGSLPFSHALAGAAGQASPDTACAAKDCGTRIDADLTAICKKALSQNPADRQPSAQEFADELAAHLEGRAARSPRRRAVSWPVALTAVLSCTMCLTGIALTIRSYRLNSPSTHPPALVPGDELHAPQTGSSAARKMMLTPENLLGSKLAVSWSMPLEHVTAATVSHVQLTPDGTHLLALYNTTSSTGLVAKIAAATGELRWQKQIPLQGRVFESGWIDAQGDVFVTSSCEEYTIWKYDSEFEHEKGRFKTGRGGEYISTVITDSQNNVYLAGCEGSYSGQGSMCYKLNGDLQELWKNSDPPSEGKPDYSLDMALDSLGHLYRVGCDNPDEDQGHVRGRVISHYAENGVMRHTFTVDEPSSFVGGVLTDADHCLYFAYSHHAVMGSGVATGTEQTVVVKRNWKMNRLWRCEIPYSGVVISRRALKWLADGSLLLVVQITVAGESHPGLASIDRQGELLWLKLVDRPGWDVTRAGAEVADRTVFLGLSTASKGRWLTEVVAVPLDQP